MPAQVARPVMYRTVIEVAEFKSCHKSFKMQLKSAAEKCSRQPLQSAGEKEEEFTWRRYCTLHSPIITRKRTTNDLQASTKPQRSDQPLCPGLLVPFVPSFSCRKWRSRGWCTGCPREDCLGIAGTRSTSDGTSPPVR